MLGWVVWMSRSSSPTFFSPLHRLLMIRSRIGADMTRNSSDARWNTSSDSAIGVVSATVGLVVMAAGIRIGLVWLLRI